MPTKSRAMPTRCLDSGEPPNRRFRVVERRALEHLDGDALGRMLRAKVAGGAIARDKLVGELDTLRSDLLVEGREQYGERDVMLIAVGGWARAVNLFATLAEGAETMPEGSEVLKLRIVLDTLLDGVGPDAEVQPVADALRTILPVATVTGRPDAPPSPEDLVVLKEATSQILALAVTGGGE